MPTVQINGTTFIIDDRLKQLRNKDDPYEFLDFETDGDMLVFLGQNADWDTFVHSIPL